MYKIKIRCINTFGKHGKYSEVLLMLHGLLW